MILINCWINQEEDGAISFWTGTHSWSSQDAHGVISTEGMRDQPVGDFFSADLEMHRSALQQAATVRGIGLDEAIAVLPRGGICLHHCRTFHGSGPNNSASGRARRSFAVHCRTDLAVPVPGSNDYYVSRLDDPAVAPVIYGNSPSSAELRAHLRMPKL